MHVFSHVNVSYAMKYFLIVYRFFVPSITLLSDIVAIKFLFLQVKQCIQKVCIIWAVWNTFNHVLLDTIFATDLYLLAYWFLCTHILWLYVWYITYNILHSKHWLLIHFYALLFTVQQVYTQLSCLFVCSCKSVFR